MKQLTPPGNKRRFRKVTVLGIMLLAPTLFVAVLLTMAPLANRAVADEPANVDFTVGPGDDGAALSQISASHTLPPGDDFDWPLDQMAAGVGILLMVMIGLPLGYRLTKIRSI